MKKLPKSIRATFTIIKRGCPFDILIDALDEIIYAGVDGLKTQLGSKGLAKRVVDLANQCKDDLKASVSSYQGFKTVSNLIDESSTAVKEEITILLPPEIVDLLEKCNK